MAFRTPAGDSLSVDIGIGETAESDGTGSVNGEEAGIVGVSRLTGTVSDCGGGTRGAAGEAGGVTLGIRDMVVGDI
ncbi:hypothetical protein L2E82_22686 [Cichorium intybus]|uniref:Uncharacterized protein n=1 Tax=Cichorium intybus TaxID=13427 RepID=A0ACB9DYQ2_CICIN|nr:hypothetical protein L2E82_22686 [Cichorium intybus]